MNRRSLLKTLALSPILLTLKPKPKTNNQSAAEIQSRLKTIHNSLDKQHESLKRIKNLGPNPPRQTLSDEKIAGYRTRIESHMNKNAETIRKQQDEFNRRIAEIKAKHGH
jgi:hypothetical protein